MASNQSLAQKYQFFLKQNKKLICNDMQIFNKDTRVYNHFISYVLCCVYDCGSIETKKTGFPSDIELGIICNIGCVAIAQKT